MPIQYILRENKLTTDPNDYAAIVSPTLSADMNAVVDRMLQRGSTVGRGDILAVLEEFTEAVASMLLDGQRLNLPFVNYRTAIRGKFTGAGDSFDPSRHSLEVSVASGPVLRERIRTEGVTEKQAAPPVLPMVQEFRDVTTGQINGTATSGGIGDLLGEELNFNPAQPDEGIFFVPAVGSAIKATMVAEIMPKHICFQIPTLSTVQYTVEVRKRYQADGELRANSLPTLVTGAQPVPP